jgi:hypothetical protein
MIEQLQSPQKVRRAVTDYLNDLRGPEKAMSANEPDDFSLALGQLHGSNNTGAIERRKMQKLHLTTTG